MLIKVNVSVSITTAEFNLVMNRPLNYSCVLSCLAFELGWK